MKNITIHPQATIKEAMEALGVDRGALIKVWLHERVKQEKALTA